VLTSVEHSKLSDYSRCSPRTMSALGRTQEFGKSDGQKIDLRQFEMQNAKAHGQEYLKMMT